MNSDKILEGISGVSKHVVDGMDEKEREDFVSFIKHELVNKLTDALFPVLDEGEKIVRLDSVTVETDYTKYGYAYRQRLHVDDLIRCKDCKYFHTGFEVGLCEAHRIPMRKNDFCSYGRRTEK